MKLKAALLIISLGFFSTPAISMEKNKESFFGWLSSSQNADIQQERQLSQTVEDDKGYSTKEMAIFTTAGVVFGWVLASNYINLKGLLK